MKYIGLLRGINVGGNKKVPMTKLKEFFESIGCKNVSTYINSGNVLFESTTSKASLNKKIAPSLKETFGFDIPTIIKTEVDIKKINKAIPSTWLNNKEQKTDVAYLFPEIDNKEIIEKLPIKKEYLDMLYIKGAIIWHLDRKNYNRSHLNKIISHPLYKQMTIRNINTARHLANNK